MSAEMKVRAPSPLQRSILILLAGLAQRGTDRVRTRDLERLLERGGDRPVYGNNLRGSCRRMESATFVWTALALNTRKHRCAEHWMVSTSMFPGCRVLTIRTPR